MTNIISMLDCIAPGRDRHSPHINRCPACFCIPAIDHAFYGKVVIYCDNDSCDTLGDGYPQALGKTLAEAAQNWNALGDELEWAGAGGLR